MYWLFLFGDKRHSLAKVLQYGSPCWKKCTNNNKRFTFITVVSISFISIQKHNLSLWWRNWNFKNSSLLLPKMCFNYTTQGSRFLSVLVKCCVLRIYMETSFLWFSMPSKTSIGCGRLVITLWTCETKDYIWSLYVLYEPNLPFFVW